MQATETSGMTPLQQSLSKIQVFPNFCHRKVSAKLIEKIFELEPLWEERVRHKYRNAPFYTIGTPSYLDCSTSNPIGHVEKKNYFNEVLFRHFSVVLDKLQIHFNAEFLPDYSYPGFHIFKPFKTGEYFFGKKHIDNQWSNIPFLTSENVRHFSYTLVLKLPYLGGGMWVWDEEGNKEHFPYEENALYVHSGQFPHAIAEVPGPILPFDYRITLQGHGFEAHGMRYLYW